MTCSYFVEKTNRYYDLGDTKTYADAVDIRVRSLVLLQLIQYAQMYFTMPYLNAEVLTRQTWSEYF